MLLLRDPGREGGREDGALVRPRPAHFGHDKRFRKDGRGRTGERARGADGAKIVAPTLPTGANQGGKKRGG